MDGGPTPWLELLVTRVIRSLRVHFAAGPIDYFVGCVCFPFDVCRSSEGTFRFRRLWKRDTSRLLEILDSMGLRK